MKSIQQDTCAFVPLHILDRIAKTEGPGQAAAAATLDETQRLSAERPRTFIEQPPKAPAPATPRRNVYDARNRERLPGTLVMSDHNPKRGKDVAVLEAWDGAGATWAFFHNVFGRNSIDGHGLRIDSTVHYGLHFTNAMWSQTQIVYGDGDGKVFNRFTACPEVIGHELTHGMTQSTAGLGYQGENGALNEHISDAFGIMIKQYIKRQTAAESDWLIGEGLFTPVIHGSAVRSMAAPGTAYNDPRLGEDPQPWHMDKYLETPFDHGGVHINSGIPNHAFYRAASKLRGYTWDVLGPVWYDALLFHTPPLAGFRDFAAATLDAARSRFGNDVMRIIESAWRFVGVFINLRKERKAS